MGQGRAGDGPRIIIHIDMDCFYAAVEMREDPRLRGKPLAVGGRGRRGVLTTCNYEARKFGLRSAMPTFMALRKCPHLTIVRPRFELYTAVSRQTREIFHDFTPLVEPLSLDEAYLDVTALRRPGSEIATEIRERVLARTQLTCSAGIAPNKLLAKIASDWRKPNGQFEIRAAHIEAFMRDLPVSKIWGIGRKTAERLRQLGIKTCGQLQSLDLSEMQSRFGKFGIALFELCRGIDHRPVTPNRTRKSLGVERTYEENLATIEDCLAKLPHLYALLTDDLARSSNRNPPAKVFVKIKFDDFSRTTLERTQSSLSIELFQDLMREAFARSDRPARLLGIGIRFAEVPSAAEQLEFAFLDS